jgi:hypothetical protein
MNQNEMKHPIARVGALITLLGLLGLLISSIFITRVESDLRLNGLSDAMTISCDQYKSLNDYFGTNVPLDDCEISAEEESRQRNADRLPLAQNLRIIFALLVPFGILLVFVPRILNLSHNKLPKEVAANSDVSSSFESRLKSLENLRTANLISEAEYEVKRQKLIEEI